MRATFAAWVSAWPAFTFLSTLSADAVPGCSETTSISIETVINTVLSLNMATPNKYF